MGFNIRFLWLFIFQKHYFNGLLKYFRLSLNGTGRTEVEKIKRSV